MGNLDGALEELETAKVMERDEFEEWLLSDQSFFNEFAIKYINEHWIQLEEAFLSWCWFQYKRESNIG